MPKANSNKLPNHNNEEVKIIADQEEIQVSKISCCGGSCSSNHNQNSCNHHNHGEKTYFLVWTIIKKLFNPAKFTSLFWITLLLCMVPFLWATLRELNILKESSVPLIFMDDYFFQLFLGTITFVLIAVPLWKGAIHDFKLRKGITVGFNIAFISTIIYIISIVLHFVPGLSIHNQYPHGMFYIMGELLIFTQLGHTIEARVIYSSEKNFDELNKLIPRQIKVEENNNIVVKNANLVKINDLIIVNKGEMLPCDGIVKSHSMIVSEKLWTGNNEEKIYYMDSEVISGYLNVGDAVTIQVKKTTNSSALSLLLKTLLNNNNKDNTKFGSIAQKFARIFFYTEMVLAVLVIIGWLIYTWLTSANHQPDVIKSFLTGISIIVAMCPCAFGITAPLILLVATWKAYKHNVAIKDFSLMEKLKNVNAVVFDKTGTLTDGDIGIKNLQYLNNDEGYADLLYTIEKYSSHPIARALLAKLGTKKLIKVTNIQEKIGTGISAKWGNKQVIVGNIHEIAKTIPNLNMNHFGQKNVMVVDNHVVCGFDYSDIYKQSTLSAITELQKNDKSIFILTGDAELENTSIQNALPHSNIYTKCKPNDKARIINVLQHEGFYNCLYVGDGLNDILAAREAEAFIAIHNGLDLSLIEGDAILLNGNLNNIIYLMRLLKTARFFIIMAFTWAFVYNLIVSVVIILGFIPPSLAAIFMVVSDIFLLFITLMFRIHKIGSKIKI